MKKSWIFASFTAALFLLLLLLGIFIPAAKANGINQGYVIIQTSNDERWIREISFLSPINGLDALKLANQDVITANTAFGVAVCSIAGVGCPADNCFCSSSFWEYSYWDGSSWQGYLTGASDTSLNDGAIEGWRWGEWGIGSLPPATHLTAANEALNYLLTLQYPDGGYGTSSSSIEMLLSIASNNISPVDWRKSGNQKSLAAYLLHNGATYSNSGAASAGKFSVGITGAHWCFPYNTKSPSKEFNPNTGVYAEGAGLQSWAMLGVNAKGENAPDTAINYLRSLIQSDGGWEWGTGYGADTNSTALAIQALIANGEPISSTIITSGLNYLLSAQNTDGGFPYDPNSLWGTDSDANSTAYAIQAILAAGQDPTDTAWTKSAGNPYDFLLSLQLADGSIEWQSGTGTNLMATQQAIPALLHRPYPLDSLNLSNCPTGFLPIINNP